MVRRSSHFPRRKSSYSWQSCSCSCLAETADWNCDRRHHRHFPQVGRGISRRQTPIRTTLLVPDSSYSSPLRGGAVAADVVASTVLVDDAVVAADDAAVVALDVDVVPDRLGPDPRWYESPSCEDDSLLYD